MKWPQSAGFTLIEVMVVSVIVAILAAMAIPAYTSYMTNTKREAALNLARTAAASASIYLRRHGATPTSADQLNIFLPSMKYEIDIDEANRLIIVTDSTNSNETVQVNF